MLVTGLTRNYHRALQQIMHVLEVDPNRHAFGLSLVMSRQTLFVADTAVHEVLSAEQIADIEHDRRWPAAWAITRASP